MARMPLSLSRQRSDDEPTMEGRLRPLPRPHKSPQHVVRRGTSTVVSGRSPQPAMRRAVSLIDAEPAVAQRCGLRKAGPMTDLKETLLKRVDGLLDLARRSRRLSPILSDQSDRDSLERYAKELEERASRIEGDAASAKTMNVVRATGLKEAPPPAAGKLN